MTKGRTGAWVQRQMFLVLTGRYERDILLMEGGETFLSTVCWESRCRMMVLLPILAFENYPGCREAGGCKEGFFFFFK